MNGVTDVFAHNPTIQAAANLLALVTGAGFLFVVGRRIWSFIRNAYQTSFKTAVRRAQFSTYRTAVSCALDIHLFICYLTARFVGLVAVCVLLLITTPVFSIGAMLAAPLHHILIKLYKPLPPSVTDKVLDNVISDYFVALMALAIVTLLGDVYFFANDVAGVRNRLRLRDARTRRRLRRNHAQ